MKPVKCLFGFHDMESLKPRLAEISGFKILKRCCSRCEYVEHYQIIPQRFYIKTNGEWKKKGNTLYFRIR